MSKRDYYEVLGVSRQADKNTIRKAYRKLAREYHPDVNDSPDAEERFKEINEAYEVLSSEQKRAAYDRFGHAGVQGAGGMGGQGVGIDIGEIFEEFFGFGQRRGRGGRRRQQQATRGDDLRTTVTIDFEDAIHGATRDVTIQRLELCPDCNGSGARSGTGASTCSQCGGSGEIRQARQSIFGQVVVSETCPNCGGSGEVIEEPCLTCHGQKRVRQERTLEVNIPPGVDDGMRIRLSGEGEHGLRGGPPGNLYVDVKVRPHEYFRRDETDILLDVEINVAQAALGDEIEIPTVDGTTTLKIPAGTQTGDTFRLRGEGAPNVRNPERRGDQIVTIFVAVPKKLDEHQRELFEELAQSLGSEVIPQGDRRGLFDRLREAFGA